MIKRQENDEMVLGKHYSFSSMTPYLSKFTKCSQAFVEEGGGEGEGSGLGMSV